MLVRGVARQQEFWIRLALGAGRGRLIRQTLTESLLLAAAGGALGTVLSVWAGRAMVAAILGSTRNAITVQADLPVILTASVVSCAAAALFGLLPAVRLARREHVEFMRQSGAGAPRLRAGAALVIAQVAIAVPLIVGAALFLRTVHNLAGIDLGFEPRGLVTFRMDPTLNGYDESRTRQLLTRVVERVSAIPGVRGATLIENALISGITSSTTFAVGDEKPKRMYMNRVGPGFFATIGLPIVAGRGIGIQDGVSAPRVGVINESGARSFFGAANPIGRMIKTSAVKEGSVEIVGVAKDSKYQSLRRDAEPTIYLPYAQSSGLGTMHVVLRTGSAGPDAEQLRRAVAEVDPNVPVADLKSQTRQIDESIGSERALMTLLVCFGGFALLLACIGLHGVTSYGVARRTNEIGIRMALGAQRRSVLWLVLRQVILLAGLGLAIGVPAAILGSRAVAAYLFGVAPADPSSIAAGAGVLFAVAIAAGFLPASAAARMDPLIALRRE